MDTQTTPPPHSLKTGNATLNPVSHLGLGRLGRAVPHDDSEEGQLVRHSAGLSVQDLGCLDDPSLGVHVEASVQEVSLLVADGGDEVLDVSQIPVRRGDRQDGSAHGLVLCDGTGVIALLELGACKKEKRKMFQSDLIYRKKFKKTSPIYKE